MHQVQSQTKLYLFILKAISKIFLSGFFLWGYKIKFFERMILCSLRMHLLKKWNIYYLE